MADQQSSNTRYNATETLNAVSKMDAELVSVERATQEMDFLVLKHVQDLPVNVFVNMGSRSSADAESANANVAQNSNVTRNVNSVTSVTPVDAVNVNATNIAQGHDAGRNVHLAESGSVISMVAGTAFVEDLSVNHQSVQITVNTVSDTQGTNMAAKSASVDTVRR